MTTQDILELLDDQIKLYQSEDFYTECIALNKFKIEILQKLIDESESMESHHDIKRNN